MGDFTSQPPATSAHTEVPGEGPTLLHLTSEGWVYVGLTLFLIFLFTFGRAWQRIRDGLDARIANTRRSMDEATAVRRDAEALLAEAHAAQARAEQDARAIVERAASEADALIKQAEADLALLIDRRHRMAEDKIAAEERAAIAEVRAQAADAAIAAATKLIADRTDAKADRALVDRAIGALGAR